MKTHFLVLFLFVCGFSNSQPLRDINYEYLYDPNATVSFQLKPVRGVDSFTVLYTLQVRDTADLMTEYSIQWEGRSLLSDKEGRELVLSNNSITRSGSGLQGRGTINFAEAPKYIIARVINSAAKRAWLFYSTLEPNYPVNNFLMRNTSLVTEPFIHTHEKVALANDSDEWVVSYYDDIFPAAAPAFSEALGRVSRAMAIDSVYRVQGGETLTFPKKGLYLVQKDTTSLQGFAFRAEEDYPQYSRLTNLAGPLVYISTKQEFDRLELAQTNKKAFDRVVLSIATEIDRAKVLMRNYFRRVELANRYFTSYKEGWKTDRGMVYIIFGLPDEVFKFDDREVWNYDSDQIKVRLTFSKSSSLFDPENFVLIREKKYEDTWYEVIDLWRNARF
jgi:GWxTD domain-containing protein